jgi:ABC-type Fe3+/spermidine/putrescine transport system ATPase subunit
MKRSGISQRRWQRKRSQAVTPAKAGVQNPLKALDPRLRVDDERITSATLYDAIKETGKIKQ